MVLHLFKLFTPGWLVTPRYWSVGRESVTEAVVDQRRPMPSYFPLSRPHSLTCSPLTASRPFIPDHSCICRLYEIKMWPLCIRNLWQVNYILLMPFLSDRPHSHIYGSDSPGQGKMVKIWHFLFRESEPYVVSLSLSVRPFIHFHCSCSDTYISWSSEKTSIFFTQAYCRSSVDQCLFFPIYRVTGSALTHLLLDHLSNSSCPSCTHDTKIWGFCLLLLVKKSRLTCFPICCLRQILDVQIIYLIERSKTLANTNNG